MLKWMIAEGYGDPRTIERRIANMEAWLEAPDLLEADNNAEYACVIDIDLNELKEPVLCCPNDPDDAKTLADVAGKPLDNHAGQLPTRLWVAPPTKMDAEVLTDE